MALLGACGDDDNDEAVADASIQSRDSGEGVVDGNAGEESGGACSSRACWCAGLCEKAASAECGRDPPLADCMMLCMTPEKAECAVQDLAALECRASLPDSAYSCAPNLDEYVVLGCDAETDALVTCLFGP